MLLIDIRKEQINILKLNNILILKFMNRIFDKEDKNNLLLKKSIIYVLMIDL